MTHTPGPWGIAGEFIVRADQKAEEMKTDIGYQSGHYICSMITPIGGDTVETANARLIAAAPELLEACKNIAGLHRDDYEMLDKGIGTNTAVGKILLAAQAAITKATQE